MNEENEISTSNKNTKGISFVLSLSKTLWEENPYSIVVFLIMTLAVVLRSYRLDVLTPGAASSEIEYIKKIVEVGSSDKLWLGKNFKDGLYIFLNSLIYRAYGLNIYYFRVFSAIAGTATVFLTYIFTKEWFNKQSAYVAGILLAFSSWHITVSRNIDPVILQPLFILLIFYFASHAFRTKKLIYVILSGLFLGLSVYVSSAFLILPLFLILASFYFYFKNKKFLSVYIKEISIVANIFALTALPYLYSLIKRPYAFVSEYSFTGLRESLYNVGDIVLSFFSEGEYNNFYNLGDTPLLDPFVTVACFLGIIYFSINVSSRKNFFLLAWIFLLSLPAVFSANFFDKIYIVLPAIYILSAVTVDHLLSEWFRTFPLNKKARTLMICLIGFFFILAFSFNYKKYFIARASSKEVQSVYNTGDPLLPK